MDTWGLGTGLLDRAAQTGAWSGMGCPSRWLGFTPRSWGQMFLVRHSPGPTPGPDTAFPGANDLAIKPDWEQEGEGQAQPTRVGSRR